MNKRNCDFGGWATKNDLKCADGRIIRAGAFKVQDGHRVPLVWNHQHNSPGDVLGHALLENRSEGVYAYCTFNKTPAGQNAKECVVHGDVTALSIWANNLQQQGHEVLHGAIREVSLVLAGANPGAFIESVMAHGEPMDDLDEEGIFHTGDPLEIVHSDGEKPKEKEDPQPQEKDETVQDVLDSMSEKQRKVVTYLVGSALNSAAGDDSGDNSDDDKEEPKVKHNAFDKTNDQEQEGITYLSHDDMKQIFSDAKRIGSLREAVEQSMEDGVLCHASGGSIIPTTGMIASENKQAYGINDPSFLFPEYRALNNPPEWLSRNMDWVQVVLGGVHRTPFSRIKSVYADITADEARAKGYIKGKQKKEEVFSVLKRTTSPQTIYKKQKMDRDDIIDITDFDVVAWIRAEMRVMLNEEIARAILIGDGRLADSDDKIKEEHVRPIVSDVDLFNVKVPVQVEAGAAIEDKAKAVIKAAKRSRKDYKGSGNPILFTTEEWLTEMLMLEDAIGHPLYKTEAELATALRVSRIVTVEPMEGAKVKIEGSDKDLIGVIINLKDYNVGADKGGEINMFDDFDIDYNQYKYLIETRISGALVKPFSALTLYLDPR